MTITETLNQVPPALCRLLARKGRGNGQKPMSNEDLARASGLSKPTITSISRLERWDRLPVETVERFMTACGVNPFKLHRVRTYLKDNRCVMLDRLKLPSQRKMYDRLIKSLLSSRQNGVCVLSKRNQGFPPVGGTTA